jgi:cation transport ATPase
LKVTAKEVDNRTVLAQIIRLVERAQGSKLPIQGLVDRVVRVFTPAVMLTALVTFIAWLVLGPPAGTFDGFDGQKSLREPFQAAQILWSVQGRSRTAAGGRILAPPEGQQERSRRYLPR